MRTGLTPEKKITADNRFPKGKDPWHGWLSQW